MAAKKTCRLLLLLAPLLQPLLPLLRAQVLAVMGGASAVVQHCALRVLLALLACWRLWLCWLQCWRLLQVAVPA